MCVALVRVEAVGYFACTILGRRLICHHSQVAMAMPLLLDLLQVNT